MAKRSKRAKRPGDEERDFALGRVIAIVNAKGGVGKIRGHGRERRYTLTELGARVLAIGALGF